jgi:type IV secretion system protein VirB4
MGSGKTVLIGFLILQSMKFGGKRILFDKDRGLEILVRAIGTYERLRPGVKTGFNPCHLSDTPENRKFLSTLLKKMLTVNNEILDESEVILIERAIEGIYRYEKPFRQLCHLAPYFGTVKNNSLRARFDQWHSDGPHAWLFDNEKDSLNLSADVIGFDIGHLLNDKECKTPALMYMTYRTEQVLEGQRGLVFFDEGWYALEDDYFGRFINDLSRTPRKKNNIFGLATQVANDTVKLGTSKAIHESAFCKFFFPNPGADRAVYVDELGLSEHEYDLVKTLPDDQHYFLLVHGRGANKTSVVLRLNLEGIDWLVPVLSAREETLILLDRLLLEAGKDHRDWLPKFIEHTNKSKK